MKKDTSNQSGFSLVQVMVALGLMGGLAVMMMQMTENQAKQQKTMELKAETNDMANLIRQTINDKEACEATFIGMSPGDNIPAIRMSADMSRDPFAEVGVKFRNSNVYIKEMYLMTRAEEVAAGQTPSGINSYVTGAGFGSLKVTFTKQIGAITDSNKSHQFFGSKETAIVFPIKGKFYDVEIVKHNQEDKLAEACYAKAATKGITCNGTAGERCSIMPLDEDEDGETDSFLDAATSQKLYLAECKYFRDDSPFMECE